MTDHQGLRELDPAGVRASAAQLHRVAEAATRAAVRIGVRSDAGPLGEPAAGTALRDLGRAHAGVARALDLYAVQLDAARHRLAVVDELLVAGRLALARAQEDADRPLGEAEDAIAAATANARVTARREQVGQLERIARATHSDLAGAAERCAASIVAATPDARAAAAAIRAVQDAVGTASRGLLGLIAGDGGQPA